MINIIPFEVEHAVALMGGELTESTMECTAEQAVAYAALMQGKGPSFTMLDDDKPIAAGGVAILWAGVGEAWLILNKQEAEKSRKSIYQMVRGYLNSIVSDCGLHRVQAHCNANLPVAAKFLEHLGFEREGLMRKYWSDGADHYLYAMVR